MRDRGGNEACGRDRVVCSGTKVVGTGSALAGNKG